MANNEFIQRLSRRDARAQSELIKKFNSRLLMYFRMRIKGEDGYEDLVQEVFVSFFAAVEKDKIEEDQFIAPFIFGIAKRVMYNFFYKKKRDDNIRKKGEENAQLTYDFEEEERLENEGMNDIITNYVDKLKEVDKIILKEFYLRENDVGQVAQLLGKTKHYVSVRKERALKKLKSEILKRGDVFK